MYVTERTPEKWHFGMEADLNNACWKGHRDENFVPVTMVVCDAALRCLISWFLSFRSIHSPSRNVARVAHFWACCRFSVLDAFFFWCFKATTFFRVVSSLVEACFHPAATYFTGLSH